MESIIRVGIIGAGNNTRKLHIPGLQALERVEIVSVCNRSRESSQRVAEQFGIPNTRDRWIEVIQDPGVDAIVIGTWPYLHCPATLAALEAGKHVLCEARMAMNAAEARAMREAARRRPDLVAQIVPSPMTLHADAIRRRVTEGYIGDPLAIEIRVGNAFIDRDARINWRQDFDLSGHNVLQLGIWYEALMRWVGEATEVMAMGQTFVKMRRDEDDVMRAVRIPDHLDVIARMACGAQTRIQMSAVTAHAGEPEARLYGSEGTLRLTSERLEGGRRTDEGLVEIDIPPEEQGRWRVEEEFVNAIRGEESVKLTTFEDGVKYMEFTEAVARSMAEGRSIPLPLTP
jgi:predicted dehydrogenase